MKTDYQNAARRSELEGLEPIITQRWSPRAYLSDAPAPADLARVFEAARLAPSCYNEQPWHFYTSTEASYQTFLDLLVQGNQEWAATAPVLGFVATRRSFTRNGKENYHADFDAGSAWMAMSLQARALGLYTHGMGGIEYDRVYEALRISRDHWKLLCGFAIGKLDPEGEEALSQRKPLADVWTAVA
ncbi:MAG: nitroreductase family protein [Halioglobus sp.]|nr:nitroreductase family protein [Halioglobus sp.]